MKQIIFTLLLTIVGFVGVAQTSNSVTIIEDPRIDHYMREFNRIAAAETMPEYIWRLQLVSTYERGEANTTQSKFRNLFPSQPSILQHDGTKFLVRGGEFTSRTDAEVFLQKIKRNFPSSFILPRERVKQ